MNYVGREPAPAGVILVGDTNPIGAIAFFHAPPDISWARLNGQILIKADYADLWAYAQGFLTADQTANPGLYRDVSGTTFAVPKLDGLFIRAQGSFDAARTSGALGVRQDDEFKSHTHGASNGSLMAPTGGNPHVGPGENQLTTARGGLETRPTNVALVPCVKALRTVLIPITGTGAPASQAEQEAGVAVDKFVAPSTQKFHPSAAKAWVRFTMANPPVILSSYGVTTVTRGGAGSYTVTFSGPMSSANYCAVVSGDNVGGTGNILPCPMNLAAGSVGICNTGASFGTLADVGICNLAIYGDQ